MAKTRWPSGPDSRWIWTSRRTAPRTPSRRASRSTGRVPARPLPPLNRMTNSRRRSVFDLDTHAQISVPSAYATNHPNPPQATYVGEVRSWTIGDALVQTGELLHAERVPRGSAFWCGRRRRHPCRGRRWPCARNVAVWVARHRESGARGADELGSTRDVSYRPRSWPGMRATSSPASTGGVPGAGAHRVLSGVPAAHRSPADPGGGRSLPSLRRGRARAYSPGTRPEGRLSPAPAAYARRPFRVEVLDALSPAPHPSRSSVFSPTNAGSRSREIALAQQDPRVADGLADRRRV